ncbi:MAG: FkbM family methyltransferase [Cyanobacteria bacterium J06600_6]
MNLVRKIITQILKQFNFELVYAGTDFSVRDFVANDYGIKSHLGHLLEQLEIDCVLDIGANRGQYGQMLRSIGYRGWIVSFEPVKQSYQALSAIANHDSQWITYQLALGATNRQTQINLFDNSFLNSCLPPNPDQELFWDEMKSNRQETVEVRTLDGIYPELVAQVGRDRRLLLKLDTQGYDLEVVKGGQESVAQALCVQSEVAFAPIYHDNPTYQDVLATFAALDFHVTNFFPNLGEDRGLAAVDMDCFLIARRALQGHQSPTARVKEFAS